MYYLIHDYRINCMIKYYQPSRPVVNYLEKELHSLQPGAQMSNAAGKPVIYKRAKEGRTKVAKAKHDAIEHIFQAFADIVYFLEFIEDHEQLHDLYEEDLKDLFGINEDPATVTRKHHYQNRGGPFSRLLAATLFYHVPKRQKLDFRMELINTVLNYAIRALQRRIEDVDEEKLMFSDAGRVLIWSRLLASRVQGGKKNKAKRSLIPYKISSV
jgi:hypothetical protein